MNETKANAIWTILEDECDALSSDRNYFVMWAVDPSRRSNEYRFCGVFGLAGKVWVTGDRVYVAGLTELEISYCDANVREIMEKCLCKANDLLLRLCHTLS